MTTEYPQIGRHLVVNNEKNTTYAIHLMGNIFAKITYTQIGGITFECPAKLSKRELKFLSIHNPTLDISTKVI